MTNKKKIRREVPEKKKRYYYVPPYGTRFWILDPFLDHRDIELSKQIHGDYGNLNIRPKNEV